MNSRNPLPSFHAGGACVEKLHTFESSTVPLLVFLAHVLKIRDVGDLVEQVGWLMVSQILFFENGLRRFS
jgi:hypothetical protein